MPRITPSLSVKAWPCVLHFSCRELCVRTCVDFMRNRYISDVFESLALECSRERASHSLVGLRSGACSERKVCVETCPWVPTCITLQVSTSVSVSPKKMYMEQEGPWCCCRAPLYRRCLLPVQRFVISWLHSLVSLSVTIETRCYQYLPCFDARSEHSKPCIRGSLGATCRNQLVIYFPFLGVCTTTCGQTNSALATACQRCCVNEVTEATI